jgi:phage gp36-like protein
MSLVFSLTFRWPDSLGTLVDATTGPAVTITRQDTLATVVPDSSAHPSTGVYTWTIDAPVSGIVYRMAWTATVAGETVSGEFDKIDTSASGATGSVIFRRTIRVAGVLTDATSASIVITRLDTGTVVFSGAMDHDSLGVYSKSIAAVPGVTYRGTYTLVYGSPSQTTTASSDQTASAATATGAYNTQSDLENRWGVQNIARWSNLTATVTTTDVSRVQLALDFAASEIDDYFAGSRYTAPLTGIGPGSSTSVKVREWANVIAGKWLADARFHATNEAVPDDLIAQLDAVYTDMALHKSGVRGFGAAQVFSNHPAVPVTTG